MTISLLSSQRFESSESAFNITAYTRGMAAEGEEFAVKNIEGMYYDESVLGCKFRVEWKAIDRKKQPPTDEPLENIKSCPMLIMDMEERMNQEWEQKCAASGTTAVGWKEPLPPTKGPKRLLDFEYIMSGKEKLAKIYSQHIMRNPGWKGPMKDGVPYLIVKFKRDTRLLLVQRGFIEYYFPSELAVFLVQTENDIIKKLPSSKKARDAFLGMLSLTKSERKAVIELALNPSRAVAGDK